MLRWTAYPFIRYTAALITGILAYLTVPSGFMPGLLSFIIGLILLTGAIRLDIHRSSRLSVWKGLGIWLILGGIGWLVTYQRTARNQTNNLLHVTAPIRAYEAVVETGPENRTKTFRLELALRRIRTDSAWQPASGHVIVYVDKTIDLKPRYGDVWLVRGAPERVEPPRNPGQFDYRRHLANRQIYHRQYLRPTDRLVLGHEPPSRLTALAHSVNGWADSVMTSHLGTGQEFAIVKAMIIGVRDAIDPDLQQAYSVAGAVHVLSVSGMHVGVLFVTLSFLLSFLKKGRRGKYMFLTVMLGLLWFYALMAGLSAPVLRSAVMFSLILFGQTLGRRHYLINTLAASAFLILLFEPYAITTAGFQLSYLAVGGLAIGFQPLYDTLDVNNRWLDELWKITAVALVAQLVTFPLGVYYFHQFPTYFWLANPAVILLSSAVLILGLALLAGAGLTMTAALISTVAEAALAFVTHWVGQALFGSMWLLNQCVRWTERLPGSALKHLTLSLPELALLCGVILTATLLVMTRRKAWVWWLAGCSMLLSASVIRTNYLRSQQHLLVVSSVPRQSVVNLVSGTHARVVSAKSLHPQEVSFQLQGMFDSLGVRQVDYALRDSTLFGRYRRLSMLTFRGRSLLMMERLGRGPVWRQPTVVDYLLISRNSLRDWRQLDGRVVARTVIFDETNKPALVDELLAEARRRGIQCHSVHHQGAFVAEL